MTKSKKKKSTDRKNLKELEATRKGKLKRQRREAREDAVKGY